MGCISLKGHHEIKAIKSPLSKGDEKYQSITNDTNQKILEQKKKQAEAYIHAANFIAI